VILCDVNVLVYAFRADTDRHEDYRAWLIERLAGPENVGVSDLVLSGFVRVVTHPRVFRLPSKLDEAFGFAQAVRSCPGAVHVTPGPRHWAIFTDLCSRSGAKGNLVPDAYLAALAIEWGCEWITTDRDYARFPGLRWRHPLAA
jgi:toxin-antitoxin system PIN domain toxin